MSSTHTTARMAQPASDLRMGLRESQTIVIRVGTEVITESGGMVAMGRLGNIVEQVYRLKRLGKNVIVVSSGAIGIGMLVLRKQHMLNGTLQEHMRGRSKETNEWDLRACAAAGQSGMQALYETLFKQFDMACAQVLVTEEDFLRRETRWELRRTLRLLLEVGIVPIINENDVVSRRRTPLRDSESRIFWDNEPLAALISVDLNADLVLIMTDIPKLSRERASGEVEHVDVWMPSDVLAADEESRVGPEGQINRLRVLQEAVGTGNIQNGCIFISANEYGTILRAVLEGESVGTLLPAAAKDGEDMEKEEKREGAGKGRAQAERSSSVSRL